MRPLVAAAVLFAAAGTARADLVQFHAGIRAGGATGKGLSGPQQDNDFFAGARGLTYGAAVGLEVLILDTWIEHDQFTDGSGVTGTWTQIMTGPHFTFAVSDAPAKQKPKLYADLGLGFGFGVGTGQQVDPPLDNSEVSDKGFLIELRAGLEYRVSPVFGIGVSVPMAWGFMVKNDVPVTDESGRYQTFRAMVVGTMTLRLGF